MKISKASLIQVNNVSLNTKKSESTSLFPLGVQFSAVIVQLEKVIMEFLTESVGNQYFLDKIISCIKAYRQASLQQKSANHFNNFMNELKQTLTSLEKIKTAFWPKIKSENLGLISVIEDNVSSNVTSHEAEQFFLLENTLEDCSNNVNVSNEDDLLDDL